MASYSFAIDAFDYILVGTLILTPVVLLISYIRKKVIRIIVSILFLLFFCVIGYIILLWSAFSSTHPKLVKTWKVDDYTIELTNRQAWAGSSYYQFDLKSVILFGLIDKTIDSYSCSSCKDNCIIEFVDQKKQIRVFNQCNGTLEEIILEK